MHLNLKDYQFFQYFNFHLVFTNHHPSLIYKEFIIIYYYDYAKDNNCINYDDFDQFHMEYIKLKWILHMKITMKCNFIHH